MALIRSIHNYYERQGISPTHFRCSHRRVCSANCPMFVGAREPYIGTGYEIGRYPRILFLSLDVPRPEPAYRPPSSRTAIAQRAAAKRMVPSRDFPKNLHWYRTHEMALTLLKSFNPELTIDTVKPYFAHTNSAKCSQGKDKGAMADPKLFTNCRRYIG